MKAINAAREALRLGPFVREGRCWRMRFGRRRFSNETVAALITAGYAKREGNMVIAC